MEEDIYKTGRGVRHSGKEDSEADVHSTGRAVRRSQREGADADVHSTGRAARRSRESAGSGHDTGRGDRANRNRRPAMVDGATLLIDKWPSEFILDDVKYKNERVLSDTSGEAMIFVVSSGGRQYALKMYYYDPESRPNHKVLEKIRQLSGSGLLVNLVSHGEWTHPDNPAQKNDYELMEFCEGGSLDGVVLRGNEAALKDVALRMASAIDFLNKHGILHRDIKPANFFYADKERTQVVLADFGISMECPMGATCKVDEMRTAVYAAPEFYTRVPGEPAEIDVRSDYYSLGVSLLGLWLGKAELTANESALLKNKLNEMLPYPSDMSPHMLSLIKSLTRLKASDRCGFEEIKRWAKGEHIADAGAPVYSDFRVIFNSARNQIAHSPTELARFIMDDPGLGKKYIYSGRVTRWLEETGRNEIAVNVEEIAERIYPKNQDAGLMAVVYMLDPAMDYIDPEGEHHQDPKEIGEHILTHLDTMEEEVTDLDSRLMVYLRAVGLGRVIDRVNEFVAEADFEGEDADENVRIAEMLLAFLLNPALRFPVSDIRDRNNMLYRSVDSIQELLDAVCEFGDVDSITKSLLASAAFVAWLAARNPAVAGKVRQLLDSDADTDSIDYVNRSAYRILYSLDPATDYYFNTDSSAEDYCFTPEDLGEMLNAELTAVIEGSQNFASLALFTRIKTNRLGDYLRSKGAAYFKFISWTDACLDVASEDNLEKPGPYNPWYGMFKAVAGFLGSAPYYLLNGKTLTHPDDLKGFSAKEIATHIPEGNEDEDDRVPIPALDAWIAQFYQEDPQADLSPKYTYENLTVRFVEKIKQYASGNRFVMRYDAAINEIDKATRSLKRSDTKVKSLRNFFMLLCGVPILFMIVGLIVWGLPLGNPIENRFMTIFPVLIIAGFCLGVGGGGSFMDGLLAGIVGGLVVYGVLYVVFALISAVATWVMLGLLIIGALALFGLLTSRHKFAVDGKLDPNDPDFQFRELDALYYAFRESGDNLDNVVTKFVENQKEYDKTTMKDLRLAGIIGAIIVYLLFFCWFRLTPQLSGENTWRWAKPDGIEGEAEWFMGTWNGKLEDGNTFVLEITKTDHDLVEGTITLGKKDTLKFDVKGKVKNEHDTIPDYFNVKTIVEEGKYTGEYYGHYYENKNELKGYYRDFNRENSQEMKIISGPLLRKAASSGKGVVKPTKKSAKPVKKKQEQSQPKEPEKKEPENLLEEEKSPVSGLWEDTM